MKEGLFYGQGTTGAIDVFEEAAFDSLGHTRLSLICSHLNRF